MPLPHPIVVPTYSSCTSVVCFPVLTIRAKLSESEGFVLNWCWNVQCWRDLTWRTCSVCVCLCARMIISLFYFKCHIHIHYVFYSKFRRVWCTETIACELYLLEAVPSEEFLAVQTHDRPCLSPLCDIQAFVPSPCHAWDMHPWIHWVGDVIGTHDRYSFVVMCPCPNRKWQDARVLGMWLP